MYLSFAETGEGGKAGTAVGYGRLSDDGARLENFKVIFRQQPKLSVGNHFGGKLAFDRQGYLFIALGENNQRPTAQETDKLQGRLVRLTAEGAVPPDNPWVGQAGKRPEVWSYGHRNPQGLAMNPWSGAIWEHEHGRAAAMSSTSRSRVKLRLAAGHLRHQLFRPADPEARGTGARHRTAAALLAGFARPQRHGVL